MKSKSTPAILIIIFFITLISSPGIISAENMKLKVIIEKANIRSKPDPTGEVVASVPQGAIFEAVFKESEWYNVKFPPDEDGFILTGYIHASAVELIAGAPKYQPEQKVIATPIPKPPQQPKQPLNPAYKSYFGEYYGGGMKLLGGLSLAKLPEAASDPDINSLNDWTKYQQGFVGGIGFETGGTIGLEFDILYTQKGAKYAGTTSYKEIPASVELNLLIEEISTPILIRVQLFRGITPFILAGGEAAYILSAKVRWDNSLGIGENQAGPEDIMENINRIEYGWILGGGIQIGLGRTALVLEARYHQGLSRISKEVENGTLSDWGKSNAIILLGGIKF